MDTRKIILMSKLAVEEKTSLKRDQKITSYYPEDYIYVNNFKTRLFIITLMGIGIMAHIFLRIQSGMDFPTTGKEVFTWYIIPYGSLVVLVSILYTIISTSVYKKRYDAAQKRIITYRKILKELEEYELDKSEEGKKNETKRKYFDL